MAQPISTQSTPISDRISRALTGALSFLAENNPRFQRFRPYQRMTDAELARRGTTRADVIRHAFSRRFYV